MSHIRRFDHVGLTVADLDVVTAFFVALGLEFEGRTFVEGQFLDTVCGIPDFRTEIVMLKPPDDGTSLELSSFVRPCLCDRVRDERERRLSGDSSSGESARRWARP